jgi:hypothetical protein
MLDRVDDPDALNAWLDSDLEWVSVDPEKAELMDALGIGA